MDLLASSGVAGGAWAVAILEFKKWGGHCRAKEEVGGPT